MRPEFWRGRRVFLTGHTGFKGSWTALWLASHGAEVTGYALAPPTEPSLFESAGVAGSLRSIIADIRDLESLRKAMAEASPEIVIHMAAQALVRESYTDPVGTYATNVMGTVHVLEALRQCKDARAAIMVTTDKVYRNQEWAWGYRETDPLGGTDPYSNSKSCAELAVESYSASFFREPEAPLIACVRAGNVIGGGDWAKDRIVRDVINAFASGKPVSIRYPNATRPWQHVLDPISGYLLLAERLFERASGLGSAYNFGPPAEGTRTVLDLVRSIARNWGGGEWEVADGIHPKESRLLALDATRARVELGWGPRLDFDATVAWTVEWYRTHGNHNGGARELTLSQIARYEGLASQ